MVSLDMLRAEQLGEAVTRSKIVLSGEERGELERRINATTVAVRDRQRAEIVVLSAAGMSQHQIAARVGVSRVTVNLWCHGTLTLFSALNYLDGKLITRIAKRHRHQEWLAFLKTIDHETPSTLDIHLIADNYATHQHAEVNRWLAKHPRFHMHFTPTSSSWLNLVERFFRDLTDFITAQSFASVGKLSDAIIAFLAEPNKNAKRYVWHAKGEDMLRKIKAARQAMVRNEASAC